MADSVTVLSKSTPATSPTSASPTVKDGRKPQQLQAEVVILQAAIKAAKPPKPADTNGKGAKAAGFKDIFYAKKSDTAGLTKTVLQAVEFAKTSEKAAVKK